MLSILIGLLVIVVVASVGLSVWLRHSARSQTIRSLEDAPGEIRIVVLGCRPRLRSGRPNRYLVDRVAAAAAAYHHRPNRRVLCSGLADETSAMAEALRAARVPEVMIDLDPDSGRTIESIDFVARRYADEYILLVTQAFHMPRALYLARSHGLDARGLIARGPAPSLRARGREKLAEMRGLFEVLFG